MNQNQQSALQDVLELLHTNFSTYETAAEYQNTTKGRKTHEGDSPEKVRSKSFFFCISTILRVYGDIMHTSGCTMPDCLNLEVHLVS